MRMTSEAEDNVLERGRGMMRETGCGAVQMPRPSTFSVRSLTISSIFGRCGLISSARRNASSARFSSPNS